MNFRKTLLSLIALMVVNSSLFAVDVRVGGQHETYSHILQDSDNHGLTSLKTVNIEGWNVAILPENKIIYKGMDLKCSQAKANDDIRNIYVRAPSWFADPPVASHYAWRGTRDFYRKRQIPFETLLRETEANKNNPVNMNVVEDDFVDSLTFYNPEYSGIFAYKAKTRLFLFNLQNTQNLEKLYNLIRTKSQSAKEKLNNFKNYGAYLKRDGNPYNAVNTVDQNFQQETNRILNFMTAEVGRKNKSEFSDLVKKKIQEKGWTMAVIERALNDVFNNPHQNFGNQELYRAIQYEFQNFQNSEKYISDLKVRKKYVKKQIRFLEKSVEEYDNDLFTISFTTGYGFTWEEQKNFLGRKRIASRNLNNVNGYPNGDIYRFYYGNGTQNTTEFGPAKYQLNRMSFMKWDLRLVEILKKHTNLHGYWAVKTPSLWHRDQRFHKEIVLFNPNLTMELVQDPYSTCDGFPGNTLSRETTDPTVPQRLNNHNPVVDPVDRMEIDD